jgi:hypothetical protein
MKIVKLVTLITALAASLLAAAPASAHGGRIQFGIGIGAPWPYYGYGPYWGPRYYHDPFYYSPPVVIQQAPTTYIERTDVQPAVPAPAPSAAPGPNPAGFWYYCRDPAGYYPSVQSCPSPWERVAPR